jgi:anti-sigma regulatory factor (Ser/Thr protein kinase)
VTTEIRRRSRRYAGTPSTLRTARSDAVRWLADNGSDGGLQSDVALVVSELASNAIEADPGEPYEVALALDDEAVDVAVASSCPAGGPGPPSTWHRPDGRSGRGRGLTIVAALSTHVTVSGPLDGKLIVTATIANHPGPR